MISQTDTDMQRRGGRIFLLPLCLFFILLFPLFSFAGPIDNDPLIHSSYAHELMLRGEYDKGLEQLRTAYLMFPLNETLKRNLAEGYAVYGHSFFKRQQYEQADENYVKAMELYPEEPGYALLRGICNYNLKKYDIARYELDRAWQKKKDSVEILYYLGLTLYESDDRFQAIERWEEGLKLAPGRTELSVLLEKARKEMAVEATMDRGHSSRFNITFDPGVTSTTAQLLLDALEEAANKVGAELGHFPEARVPVVIYKRDDYKFVTDSPDWSGGVYDGTIRLPFGGLQEVTPRVKEVLYHEYAHVVVYDLTHGNCPTWLNEGIAEFFGRLNFNRPLNELGRAARANSLIGFESLASGFTGFSAKNATLAYQQSYAFVNHIVTTYGWHRITGILKLLGKGRAFESAFIEVFKDYTLTFDHVRREWQTSLEQAVNTK